MIEYKRKEYVNETRLFVLTIDQSYIDQVVSEIKRIYGVDIELTEKDFEDALECEDNDTLETELTRSYVGFGNKEVTYKTTIRDLLREWINDDTWDQDYEVIDCDTKDVYDDYTVI